MGNTVCTIYKMVIEVYTEELNKEVNRLLAGDWELYGSPFSIYDGEKRCSAMCQSLVRKYKDQKQEDKQDEG